MVALISPRSCKSDVRQGPCFLIPLRRRLPPLSESTILSDFSRGKGLRDYRDRWISLQRVWKRNAFLLSKKIVIIACSTFLFEKFESIGEIILEINFHYGSKREREKGRSKRKFSYDITSQLHLIRGVSTNTLFGIFGILIERLGNNQIRLTTNFNNFKLLIRLNLIIESFWISSKTGVSNFSNSKDNVISERHGGILR